MDIDLELKIENYGTRKVKENQNADNLSRDLVVKSLG